MNWEDIRITAYWFSKVCYQLLPYVLAPLLMVWIFNWFYDCRARWFEHTVKKALEATYVSTKPTVHDLMRNIVSARIAMEKFVDENFPVGSVVWIDTKPGVEPEQGVVTTGSFEHDNMTYLLIINSEGLLCNVPIHSLTVVNGVDDFEAWEPWVAECRNKVIAAQTNRKRLVQVELK